MSVLPVEAAGFLLAARSGGPVQGRSYDRVYPWACDRYSVAVNDAGKGERLKDPDDGWHEPSDRRSPSKLFARACHGLPLRVSSTVNTGRDGRLVL